MSFIDGQIMAVVVFFVYNFLCESCLGCCGGMWFFGRKWRVQKTIWRKMLYIICYTISFSTLVLYVYVPLDLFVINMVFFQLLCIIIKQNTLHGYIGDMETVYPDPVS